MCQILAKERPPKEVVSKSQGPMETSWGESIKKPHNVTNIIDTTLWYVKWLKNALLKKRNQTTTRDYGYGIHKKNQDRHIFPLYEGKGVV